MIWQGKKMERTDKQEKLLFVYLTLWGLRKLKKRPRCGLEKSSGLVKVKILGVGY